MFHKHKDANGNPRHTRVGASGSVFDAIQEGIDSGWYPPNARLGPRVYSGHRPENAIAEVTVRQHESFWIIAPTGTHYDEATQRWVAN